MSARVTSRLRPDPGLPHRDLLLEDGFVRSWLSSHLGTDGPIAVDFIERTRVKYRIGESLRVVYRLRAGAAEATIAARMFRPGRSSRVFREASAMAAAVGPLRGVGHASELDTVFWTFPNDRRIADLPLLRAPASRLARALGRDCLRTRVVAYAPEKSATAACLSESGEVLAFAKAFAGDEAPRVSAIYRDVDRALRRSGASLRVPRVLGRSRHTLVLEAIEGACVSRLPAREGKGGVERLGAALGMLHTLPPPAAPFRRLASSRLQQAATLIAQVRPDVGPLVRDLAQGLASGRAAVRETLVRLHGDVHPKNALLESGQVALIDLDQSAAGPAAADLGSFLAYLGSERVLGRVSASDERSLASAFLAGYATVHDLPAPESLRWHIAAALLSERALRAVNRFRPDALAGLADLLSCARDLLTRRGDA